MRMHFGPSRINHPGAIAVAPPIPCVPEHNAAVARARGGSIRCRMPRFGKGELGTYCMDHLINAEGPIPPTAERVVQIRSS